MKGFDDVGEMKKGLEGLESFKEARKALEDFKEMMKLVRKYPVKGYFPEPYSRWEDSKPLSY